MPTTEGKLIASWKKNKSSRNMIRVYRSKYKGHEMVSIVEVYENESGETKYAQHVNLTLNHIAKLRRALREANV